MRRSKNQWRTNVRAAITFVLVFFMVWGSLPAPALAQMAEGEAKPMEPTEQVEVEEEAAPDEKAGASGEDKPESEVEGESEPELVSELASFSSEGDAANTLTVVVEGSSVSLDEGTSNEDLLDAYVQQEFDEAIPHERSFTAQSAYEGLDELDASVVDALRPLIVEVASGDRASTQFEFDATYFAGTQGWTAQDLGVDAIVVDGSINKAATAAALPKVTGNTRAIMNALLKDLPYDLYWFDKTAGMGPTSVHFTARTISGEWVLYPKETFSYCFSVAQEYATGEYSVDTALGKSVQTAVANAQAVVSDNNGKALLERLDAYRAAICDKTSYNRDAVNNNAPYGNPWQLVWVFDNDESTKVVCEGYSKAFKYLCDLTWPERDNGVECLLASGTMTGGTGAGAHMWNVMHMDDGKNYLVDVTNCDAGTIGAPDKLFLAPKASGTYAGGYVFTANGQDISYEYDDGTKASFGEAALTISGTAYVPQVEAPVAVGGLVYDGTEQTGVEAGTGYTLTGVAAATNAGEYTATATLKNGYTWSDGTTDPVQITGRSRARL